MRVLGVDPGVSGALALWNGSTLEVHDMPVLKVRRGKTVKTRIDRYALARMIDNLIPSCIDKCMLESVGGVTGQSASAAFNFGRSAGLVEGIIAAAFIPIEDAPPNTWKRAMRVKGGKDASRARASDLFPTFSHFWARVKDDGRAEAALLALYGMEDNNRARLVRPDQGPGGHSATAAHEAAPDHRGVPAADQPFDDPFV